MNVIMNCLDRRVGYIETFNLVYTPWGDETNLTGLMKWNNWLIACQPRRFAALLITTYDLFSYDFKWFGMVALSFIEFWINLFEAVKTCYILMNPADFVPHYLSFVNIIWTEKLVLVTIPASASYKYSHGIFWFSFSFRLSFIFFNTTILYIC